MKLRGTRVQYGFLLHRNCFLLINMLENFIKCQNFQNFKIIKIKKLKFKGQFENFQKFHKISKTFKNFKVFIKFQNQSKIEPYVIKQLLHLNEINMRFHGAEYNNIERGV